MESIVARKMHRTLEPFYGMIFFTPAAPPRYAAAGVTGRQSGYFASRAAPMGAVPAEVVIATFFNFYPGLVRDSMAGVWDNTDPHRLVEARLGAADEALREVLGESVDSPEMVEAAELARPAVADPVLAGRPLGAANAALRWPDEPHLVLWHALGVHRELRGDGHIAVLGERAVGPCESLVLHAATEDVPAAALQGTRMWPEADWKSATAGLVERGLLESDGAFTDSGAAFRSAIENRTDELAVELWEPLGEGGCHRLRELVRPWSRALLDSGHFGFGR